MSPRRIVAPLLLFALFAPFAAAQTSDLATRLDAAIQKHLKKKGCVGLSVGVAHRGEVVERGYGLAEAEFRVPAKADTMFRIGSVTKQFTAALVMRLVEQQKVALDDALSKFVPEFDTQGKVVTVRQLLDHTSGIKSYTDVGEEWERVQPLELTHEQMFALVEMKPFDFEPGTDWAYNNTGYYLLGVLLEKVHEKPYAQIVLDEISTPLGLTRTRYDSNKELIENRAQGYDVVDGAITNDDLLGTSHPFAAGALLSTGGDLVRWAMALQGGKVVKPESFTAMTTKKVLPNGHDTNYGFGLIVDDFAGRPRISHGGGIHGFNSSLLWLPGDEFYVAVISNGGSSAHRIAEDLTRTLLDIEAPKAADLPIPEELGKRVVGSYQVDTIGLKLSVTQKDGKLYAQGEGQNAFRLLYEKDREFRAEFDAAVKLVWTEDGKSFALHQGGAVLEAKRMGD